MYVVILVYFGLVLIRGEMQQVKLPIYTPPLPEEILNTYFYNWNETVTNKTKKSILNVSDKYYKTLETMKKELLTNLSNLESNSNFSRKEFVPKNKANFISTDLVKNILMASIEPTTYRYPTAVWSSHRYEKLKNNQRFRTKNSTQPLFIRPTLNSLYVYLGQDYTLNGSESTQKKSRGKIKWMDIIKSKKDNPNDSKKNESEFLDKFLEQSLEKYLVSSNLKNSFKNVSVKTFSKILKNITDTKFKKHQSPYDENRELRKRFREEVILRKKNETKPQEKFLEKQLQKRLEKVQDVFREVNKEKILTNMWKYMTLNRSMEALEKTKNKNIGDFFNITATIKESETNWLTMNSPQNYNVSLLLTTIDKPKSEININDYNKRTLNTTKNNSHLKVEISNEPKKKETDFLKLKTEESSYYNNRRQFPNLTFIGKQDKLGIIIPGTPQIDYPIHSFPPVTRFKCPKFKDDKPKMMADKATRCQVFYICTGDGPTTAMLCPNGTMFNENFLVCDWWYNVHC